MQFWCVQTNKNLNMLLLENAMFFKERFGEQLAKEIFPQFIEELSAPQDKQAGADKAAALR